jgi:hypothetical protein
MSQRTVQSSGGRRTTTPNLGSYVGLYNASVDYSDRPPVPGPPGSHLDAGTVAVLLVKLLEVVHRAATAPSCRECIGERVPIGHILESPESMGVMGGSSRSNTSHRHELLPNAQKVGPQSVW